LITLPADFWIPYFEACDFFLDDRMIGKLCTLLYPPVKTECVNCTTTSFGGISTNVYKHGGPAPFYGTCPVCGGNGFSEVESTDTIPLRIYWQKKNWIKFNNIVAPDAEVQVIGYTSDLTKLLRANEIMLISDQTFIEQRYQLEGEPFLHGFGKGRYFIAFLTRVLD
jgi:hypothetical protein